MLRLNRMKPHGRSPRMKSRSAALNSSPDTPVMNARLLMGPIRPLAAPGSRKPPLIPWDEALSAGRFQAHAELRCLVRRPKRTDHRAVYDALFAKVGALDHRRPGTQRLELALQRLVRGLCVGLGLLRGDLNEILPTGGGGRRLGRIDRRR